MNNPYQTAPCATLPGPSGLMLPRNVQQRRTPPNHFNACLDMDLRKWERINAMGGLMATCPGRKFLEPPWDVMPAQGKNFPQIGSIALPDPDGLDHLVTSFHCQQGYDGVIKSIVQTYSGQGFLDGDGQITWRVTINQRYVKGYGATLVQLGSLTQGGSPSQVGEQIILQSNQLVQYWVNISTSAQLNGGRIICGFFGWQWPR